ncbi:MAG: short-chain dehydrogenase/reductase [Hyphomicrobiales bacterium]|nr:short-chain dehydrogenase/reductase [Hyphomicrobiales bacterium]
MERIALVTGAGSGIGQASALALARAGWTLVLAGRRVDKIEAVARVIADAGGKASALATDVTDEASVERLFAGIAQRHGRLDLLFNNAGQFSPPVLFEDLTLAQWKNVVDVNLTGVFLCSRAAVRLMKAQSPHGGRIINNGSISAHVPRPNSAPYTATKHAITGLTRSLALDGRPYDIVCGQIDIGNADTELVQRMKAGVRQPDGSVQPEAVMDVRHAADAVVMMAGLPLEANVLFMTVMATKMPYVGRG